MRLFKKTVVLLCVAALVTCGGLSNLRINAEELQYDDNDIVDVDDDLVKAIDIEDTSDELLTKPYYSFIPDSSKVLKKHEITCDNPLVSGNMSEYDIHGNLTKSVQMTVHSIKYGYLAIEVTYDNKYNEKEQLIERTSVDSLYEDTEDNDGKIYSAGYVTGKTKSTYKYDAYGNMLNEKHDYKATDYPDTSEDGIYEINYAYDNNGNMTKKDNGYDEMNYSYDNNGNLIKEKHGSDETNYSYDNSGRLIQQVSQSEYDGETHKSTIKYEYKQNGNSEELLVVVYNNDNRISGYKKYYKEFNKYGQIVKYDKESYTLVASVGPASVDEINDDDFLKNDTVNTSWSYTYEYDSTENPRKVTRKEATTIENSFGYNNGGTSIFEYDSDGDLISYSFYNTKDELTTTIKYEYYPNITYSPMYRLYNPNSGEHFYTKNETERDTLSELGWKYEGVAWNAPDSSDTPVYRLYNPNAGDHHYTTSKSEKDTLVSLGWKDEGIGWYSSDKYGQALYRLYNPNAKAAGSHHYTTSADERDNLVSLGWRDEGIAWYGGK